ncbi:MAG: DUF853 domain-containing protein, partial [Robiginitomaculum sp.]|nr:DUF853 domain-containing protein [Robiginitomaculum sp.]
AFDTETVITDLGIGEALVSTLDKKGRPSMVARTLIRPPASRLGPINSQERKTVIANSPLAGVYENAIDRNSAYEGLATRKQKAAQIAAEEEAAKTKKRETMQAQKPKRRTSTRKRRSSRQSIGEAAMKTVIRTAASQITRQLLRGVLGGLFR